MHVRSMQPTGISLPRSQLAGVIGQCILYGIHIVVSALALFLLIRKRERNSATNVLIVVTVAMFIISTLYLALVTEWSLDDFLTGAPTDHSGFWLPLALAFFNSLIGDLITIWRAWVLWERDHRALVVPMLLWTATFAVGIADCYENSLSLSGLAPLSYSSHGATLCLAFQLLTFLTNLAAVVLIGYRYWIYRQEVVEFVGPEVVEHKAILILLIESGALYCASWLILAIVYISTTDGVYVILQLITQFTSLYPTLTIVLVCMRLSQEEAIEELNYKVERAELACVAVKHEGRIPRISSRPRLPELSLISLNWRSSSFIQRRSVRSSVFNSRLSLPGSFHGSRLSLPGSFRGGTGTGTAEASAPPSSWRLGNHGSYSSIFNRAGHRPSQSTNTHGRPEWRASSIIRQYSNFHRPSFSISTTRHNPQEWRTSSIIHHYSSYDSNLRSMA